MDLFKPYLPANVRLEFRRVVPDLYSQEDYQLDLEEAVRKFNLQDDPLTGFNPAGFEFNFLADGQEDFTKLNELERLELFKKLEPYSAVHLSMPRRRAFNRGEDKIVIFSAKIPNAIDIGSIASSKAKFWAGTGIVEIDGDQLVDRILSPKQFDEVKNKLGVKEVEIGGYQFKVGTYEGRLNFRGVF
jgi:hypothetical protein